ncbi:MAG TPA: hypothetical protein VI297_02930, partial [Gemmatimonadales bacterium]
MLAGAMALPAAPRPLSPLTSYLSPPGPAGPWRAVLDLAGGPLPFGLVIDGPQGGWRGRLCNGDRCDAVSGVRVAGDSV